MRLVLRCVDELGRAKSREVAKRLSIVRVEYTSLVLTRCKRRGYVKREPYRRGREHGYVYQLTKRGAEWMMKKAEPKRKKTSNLSTTSSPASKSSTALNSVLWSLMQDNEAYERENLELSNSLIMASLAYCKCSSERDFIFWQYLSEREQRIELEGTLEVVTKNIFLDMKSLIKAAFPIPSRTCFSTGRDRMRVPIATPVAIRLRGLAVQGRPSTPIKSFGQNEKESLYAEAAHVSDDI